MVSGKTAVAVFENSVPPFIEAKLDSLYGHVFSSLMQFKVYDGLGSDIHTYIAENDGRTSAVLLFRINGKHVQVLNEQISVPDIEAARFARHVFDTYPAVEVVSFKAIQAQLSDFDYPYQRFFRTEDIVLSLPESTDTYMNSLGKATKKNFKQYVNRVRRNLPELETRMLVDEEIAPEYVRDVVVLNRARMAKKNKTSEMDEAETERLIRLVRQSGLACIMLLDGRVVAGTVCSRVDKNYFMHLNAHDPACDEHRLGKVCCYQTICESIKRGGKEFHFMWGRFDYKYLLLGVQRDYDQVVIYRSPLHYLLNARTALPLALEGRMRTLKFQLLDIADGKNTQSRWGRSASRALNFLRDAKRSGFRLHAPRH